VKILHIKDPFSGKTLIKIRDPKIPISNFTNNGEKCVDLQKIMRDKNNVTPDFGFDVAEI